MKFIFSLQLLILSLLATGCATGSVEDLTLSVPFKSNAYVTPLDKASKQTPKFADQIIANSYSDPQDAEMKRGSWKAEYYAQQPHQISIYFYTAHTGSLQIGLRATQSSEGVSKLNVKIGAESHTLSVKSGADGNDYYVGEYQIAEAGYICVDIEPISTTAASYPEISALLLGGEAINNATQKIKGEVVFVSEEDTKDNIPHFVRRGPSNHFMWQTPDKTEYFYNEVLVPEGEDTPGSYYMLTGGDGFYMGIQPNEKGKNRTVLFSVWDTDTEKGLTSELVNNGKGVKSNAYSHEGSGVQNFYYYDWEAGKTYATLVRVRPEIVNGRETGASLYTGYFRGEEGWVFLAEIRRPGIKTYYTGAYSFCENFMPECGWIPRGVKFPAQWMRDSNGQWHEVLEARFSCDGTGRNELRRDYEGGVSEEGYFYLRNIGYINENVAYGTKFTRKGSGKAPEIDLQALIKLAGSKDKPSVK